MFASDLSEAGWHFWIWFTVFLIVIALLWWGALSRCGSGKAREILTSKYVFLFNIFNLFVLAGFLSGAPFWDLFWAVVVYAVILFLIGLLCNSGCCRRRRWGNSCNDSCGESINSCNDSCNNSYGGFNNRWGCNFNFNWNSRCGNGWAWFLFAIFWAWVGAAVGLALRHVQRTCLISSIKILSWTWFVAAILGVFLFALLWIAAWQTANKRARCIMLNKRVWVLLYFWFGLWFAAVGRVDWWWMLLAIIVWRIVAWGLSYSWCFFRSQTWYCWQTIVAFFVGAILGRYVVLYFQLQNGEYLAKCGPSLTALKGRLY